MQSDALIVKLKYNEPFFTFTEPASGAVNSINDYQGNGLYDPDYEISQQPSAMGLSLYGKQYQNYVVLASSIKVTYVNNTGLTRQTGTYGTSHPRECFVVPMTLPESASSPINATTVPNVIFGQPYCKKIMLGPALTSKSVGYIKHYMTTRKLFGGTDPLVDRTYWGGVTSDPATKWFWYVGAIKNASVEDALSIDYKVEITYYVRFWNRINPTTA